MTRPVDLFARRVETDSWFLGFALALYAQSEDLNDERLASTLGCSVADLTSLRLCRRPLSEPAEAFGRDIDTLVRAYGVRADVIAAVARRADAVDSLRRSAEGVPGTPATLMAARDRERNGRSLSDREDRARQADEGNKGDDVQ